MQKGNEKLKVGLEPRIINIFDRQKIEVVGVQEIVSSTESEIFVKLSEGVMRIVGEGLVISKLIPEEVTLVVDGKINGLNFISKMTKKSLFRKVFK